jgi:GDP-D-mannose dehydratase
MLLEDWKKSALGDASKARNKLGWKPKISFRKLVAKAGGQPI